LRIDIPVRSIYFIHHENRFLSVMSGPQGQHTAHFQFFSEGKYLGKRIEERFWRAGLFSVNEFSASDLSAVAS